MRKEQVKNRKRSMYNSLFIAFIFFAVFTLFTAVLGLINLNNDKEANLYDVEITVSEVSLNKEEEKYYISSADKKYYISTTYDDVPNLCEMITTSDTIILTLSKVYDNASAERIYKIKKGNNTLLDMKEQYKSSNVSSILVGGLSGLIFTALMIVFLILKLKQPKFIEEEYIESVLKTPAAACLFKFKKGSECYKKEIRGRVAYICLIAFSLIFVLYIPIAVSKYNIWFLIGLIIGVIIFIALLVMTILFMPRFNTKNKDLYLREYVDYLDNNGSFTSPIIQNINFLKEGFKINHSDESVSYFDYRDLNLYTCAVFGKNFGCLMVYICSDFGEEAKTNDIIIPLTHEVYMDIINNHVYIKGFQYIMENMNSEIESANKDKRNKIIVKKYFD